MSDLDEIQTEVFHPTLDFSTASVLAVLSCSIFAFALLVQISIFRMLLRKKGRTVNKIILCQQVTNPRIQL